MTLSRQKDGLIVNTDDGMYKSIVARRNERKKTQALCEEFDAVKQELIDIRTLLDQILTSQRVSNV